MDKEAAEHRRKAAAEYVMKKFKQTLDVPAASDHYEDFLAGHISASHKSWDELHALKLENSKSKEDLAEWMGKAMGDAHAIDCLSGLNESLKIENARLKKALTDVDLMLRVPAAEYVPAIGDVFTIIDAALNPAPICGNCCTKDGYMYDDNSKSRCPVCNPAPREEGA